MLLAAENNYPLLEVIWTIIVFFAWVIWIWTVIAILSDVFRRHDLSGGGKAGWTFLVILLPFLGVLIYLISQGQHMAERNVERARETQKMYEQHIREVAGGGGGAAARSPTPRHCSPAATSRRRSSSSSSARPSPRARYSGVAFTGALRQGRSYVARNDSPARFTDRRPARRGTPCAQRAGAHGSG